MEEKRRPLDSDEAVDWLKGIFREAEKLDRDSQVLGGSVVEKDKTNFVFVPTWRCNLRCEYCDYRAGRSGDGFKLRAFGREFDVGSEILWPAWLYMLNRFRPYHLDMTGGEPLCYEGLADFMAHLPHRCTWAITSNTLAPKEIIERFSPWNCVAWTASYHYVKDGEFFRNLTILKNKGFPLRVTMVLTPQNHGKVARGIKILKEQLKIPVNIHPLYKQGFDWKDYQKIYDRFQAMHDGEAVRFITAIPTRFIRERRNRPIKCWAGTNYFALWPDGTLFRCYTEMIFGEPIGHIKDYVPPVGGRACEVQCSFHCDKERALKEA